MRNEKRRKEDRREEEKGNFEKPILLNGIQLLYKRCANEVCNKR